MTTQEIKEFLKLEYTKKNQNFNKYPIEVIETLLNIVNDLDHSNYEKSIKCKIAFYLSKHNIDTIPKCGYNNCTKPKEFIRISKGFKMGCCGNHTRKLSLLKKYGVENISYLVETKNKISKANKESALEAKIKRSKTNLEKFNVENTFNIADFRDKSINTNLEKYGVDHHTKSKEFQEKERIRCYEKTGYFHHSENPEVREKISKSNKIKGQEIAIKSRLTVRNRYGVDNISQLDEIKVKKKNTCLNNYGVLHPMHDEKIFEKNQKTRLTKKKNIFGKLVTFQLFKDMKLLF